MSSETSNNGSVIVEKNGSHFLLVSFGGVKMGYGMPIFEFKNILKSIDCDKIFVRDHHQCWYQKGSDDKINSRKKLFHKLRDFVQEGNYKKIIFLGNSMGGFAAIYFGVLIQADCILAFSPQTFIDSYRRFYYKDRRWQIQLSEVSRMNFLSGNFDLKRLLKKNKEYQGHIRIFFGASDELDALHATRLKGIPNVTLLPMEEQDHSVVRHLRDTGVLKNYILEGFE